MKLKLAFMVFIAVAMTGCVTPPKGGHDPRVPRKPARQSQSLSAVRLKLARLQPGMRRDQVGAILGRPAVIDDRSSLVQLWFYLPDEVRQAQMPDKLRLVFTDGIYAARSWETTYRADYRWAP